jgi:hypothetical protein
LPTKADQVPVDFGNFCCSNINADTMRKLRRYYGLPDHPIKIKDMSTMVGVIVSIFEEKICIRIFGQNFILLLDRIRSRRLPSWKRLHYFAKKLMTVSYS